MNYTALGATINLAARLEGLNKNYGTKVLVSAALKERVEGRFSFRSVDEINPKGFAQAVRIFELRSEQAVASELAFCQRWEIAYAAIGHDPPTTALVRVAEFLARYPDDGVAQYHAERLRAGLQEPRLRAPAGALK